MLALRQRVQPRQSDREVLADSIAKYTERPDESGVMGRVEQLLDESIAANEYLIPDGKADALFDVADVGWDRLEEAFKQGRPRTAAQRLRSLLSAQIAARGLYAQLYAQKCDAVYQHVFDSYWDDGRSVYELAA
jgi:hypothetical protein